MEGFSYDRKSILEKYDSTPTANSTNLVDSGAIKNYVDTEVDSIDAKVDDMIDRVGNPFTFKGTVSALSNLPSTGNTTNDTYFVEAEGFMYTWNGSSFTKSSSDVNNQLARDIATEYSTTKSNYKKGDFVLYNNQTYVRKEDATGAEGTFVTANWTAVSIADHLVTFKGEVEYDLTNLKSAIITQPLWEQGAISTSTGINDSGTATRVRSKEYIFVDSLISATIDTGNSFRVACYDVHQVYLGTFGWTNSGTGFTKSNILTEYPNTVYIRPYWKNNAGAEITPSDASVYHVVVNISVPIKNKDALSHLNPPIVSEHTYVGERINIGRNTFKIELVPSPTFRGAGQDGDIYENWFFGFTAAGQIGVTNLLTGETSTINLDPNTPIMPHANCVCFGNKYDENDLFPVLYVNAYNATGADKGVCYVYRLGTNANNVPTSATLVQTIHIGFVDDPIWMSTENESRPYGNFLVDVERGFLYVYTCRDLDSVTRFFRFYLPKIGAGYESYNLSKNDIFGYFDVPYIRIPQGAKFVNGKIYSLSGGNTENNPGVLTVVDPNGQCVLSYVDLYKNGLTFEPEYICRYDNGLYVGHTDCVFLTF